ncbi:hypothetical protein ABZ912_15575 [Nonomuraea angiospora]|uniref:hypothetical protein n=1 Tax=Nonomuraea angiospora TaxID=46172 RepID=UPI0033DBC273
MLAGEFEERLGGAGTHASGRLLAPLADSGRVIAFSVGMTEPTVAPRVGHESDVAKDERQACGTSGLRGPQRHTRDHLPTWTEKRTIL